MDSIQQAEHNAFLDGFHRLEASSGACSSRDTEPCLDHEQSQQPKKELDVTGKAQRLSMRRHLAPAIITFSALLALLAAWRGWAASRNKSSQQSVTREADSFQTVDLWRGTGAAHIVWPPQLLQHAGEDCWESCGSAAGDCTWCGAGNACCRWGVPSDPEECRNIKNWVVTDMHTCVQPLYPTLVKHGRQNCWGPCGGKAGFCDWCGKQNACCREGNWDDPAECQQVVHFERNLRHHQCVATTAGCAIGEIDDGNGQCVKPPRPPLMTFYFYRAKTAAEYEDTNVNGANLPGVMWYLHNEVIRSSCPRKFGITRVLRYKLTMRPTKDLYKLQHNNFDLFRQFDKGRCTHPGCEESFRNYGFVVGCILNNVAVANYPHTTWFDLPGICPSQEWNKKTIECIKDEPGGQCPEDAPVTGARDCTWKLEYKGELSLEELSGISNYDEFCKEGKREYDPATDKGVGFSFWDGKLDGPKCEWRMHQVLQAFKRKYPSEPEHLGDVRCDGRR